MSKYNVFKKTLRHTIYSSVSISLVKKQNNTNKISFVYYHLSQEIAPLLCLPQRNHYTEFSVYHSHSCLYFYCICVYLWAIYNWTYLENIVLTGFEVLFWNRSRKLSSVSKPVSCTIQLPPNYSFHSTPFDPTILHSIQRDFHKTHIRSCLSLAEKPSVISH